MGQCISKGPNSGNNIQSPERRNDPNRLQPLNKYGITIMKGGENQLKFVHSPLTACEFLNNKFSEASPKPEEIQLNFMILGVEIDIPENLINISYINLNEVNIYVLLGGEQSSSLTGLTVQINRIKYVEKINKNIPSKKYGDRILVVPSKMEHEPIFVIMEPVLTTLDTIFLINRYLYSSSDKQYKLKSQSMQWSSLAFDLQDIYGADNLFKFNNAEETCLLCLTNPSNVILTPCRHMCLCNECSGKYEQSMKKCPMCRTQYRAIIHYNNN